MPKGPLAQTPNGDIYGTTTAGGIGSSRDSAQLRLMLTSEEVGRKDLSAMAVVLATHKPMVIHICHWVNVVGADRVAQSAEKIVSSVDDVLDETVRK